MQQLELKFSNWKIRVPSRGRLFVIAGPCLVESIDLLRNVAEELVRLSGLYPIDFVFKASYRKANRTSSDSKTGIGDEAALKLLGQVREEFKLPILTDIHLPEEAARAASVCDILQIPAFLSRQSDLLIAAAKTGKVVNIKKGQFMSPNDMEFARKKVLEAGNNNVMLTERGTFFGYGDLVVDFRSIEVMRGFSDLEGPYSPVIFDATHSVQRPSQAGKSGGNREFILPLAKAAIAIGADGLFIETHPNPSKAWSDKDTQLPLSELEAFLKIMLELRKAVQPT